MAQATISQLEGADRLLRLLAAAGPRAMDVAEGALSECADELVTQVIPVTPIKTGTLRNSILNYGVKRKGSMLEAIVGAGGPSIPYARRIHELPQQSNWTEPGTGPKYLERPAQAYPLGRRLGSKLRGRLERAIRGGA